MLAILGSTVNIIEHEKVHFNKWIISSYIRLESPKRFKNYERKMATDVHDELESAIISH